MGRSEELHPTLDVYVGLVHWPVYDRAGNTVCTNITNFDIHDIARISRAHGISKYFLINRVKEQLMFADRIIDHWKTGYGNKYNPMRSTALGGVQTVETLEQAIEQIHPKPLVVATAARNMDLVTNIGFRDLRARIENEPERPLFIIFGTGFGLSDEALKLCDLLLEPICGASKDDYRHLSVRTAVSICLDRLLATW